MVGGTGTEEVGFLVTQVDVYHKQPKGSLFSGPEEAKVANVLPSTSIFLKGMVLDTTGS